MPTTPKPTAPSATSSSAAIDLSCFYVPARVVDRVWPAVEKTIDAAYKEADAEVPPNVIDELRRNQRQLWVCYDGRTILFAGLTRLVKLRSGLACQITACGGSDSDRWVHLLATIESFALRAGCRKVFWEGREGWQRKVSGYKRTRIMLEKELVDGRGRYQDNPNGAEQHH